MAPSKPVSYFNVKTPLEASSESKHPSDLSSLFFSLPHPSSPLHGHHHRLHFTPLSRFHVSTSPNFSPQFLPSSPLFLLYPPALDSSHRFARPPVCLLRPVILTALLLLLPRPPVVSFPSPRLPFPSVPRSSWFLSSSLSPGLHSPLHPPIFSLLHPVFLLSDQALFSLHPFLRLVSFTLIIHTDTILV